MSALAADASDLDRLRHWVDSVKLIPRFLRTKDAKALMDGLTAVGILAGADLVGAAFDGIAARLGSSETQLRSALGKCPFGI
jgi:hypothetical protein